MAIASKTHDPTMMINDVVGMAAIIVDRPGVPGVFEIHSSPTSGVANHDSSACATGTPARCRLHFPRVWCRRRRGGITGARADVGNAAGRAGPIRPS